MMATLNIELLNNRITESGYTQEKLAKKMKCSRGTIVNVAKGYTTPSLYIIKKLVEILELSREDLIDIFFSEVYEECEDY